MIHVNLYLLIPKNNLIKQLTNTIRYSTLWETVHGSITRHYYVSSDSSGSNDDDGFVDDACSGNGKYVKVLKFFKSTCKRFGQERLSRRYIQIIVAFGFPSLEGKVATSTKRLREFIHLDLQILMKLLNRKCSCKAKVRWGFKTCRTRILWSKDTIAAYNL
jgi:hypothetical protein